MSRFVKWAQTERQPATRFAVTLLAGVLFLFLLPYLFIVVCPAIDQRLGIGEVNPGLANFILGYLGLCIAVGTVVGAALVIVLATLLLVYLKRVEEKELAERFGEPYLAYKQQVPFIIPKLW